ncbi:MAG: Ldh family oxidoreductase [Rhizobiaceae bacterium]
MARISADDLERLCFDAIVAAGGATAPAVSLARNTVMTECMGQVNHGVRHLFDYLSALREGRIDGKAVPDITHPAQTMILSDAGGGIAQLGFDIAFDQLIERTQDLGMAIFLQNNSFTCGALGLFAWRLAREGLVAWAGTNGPPLLAGSGSKKPVFCTNPMAFSAPQADGPPMLIDQSSSATAFAEIRAAAREGKTIPEGWAIDADGNPTTDPNEAIKGALLGFGGSRGANIAMMMEIMSAGLSGANWGLDAPSFLTGNESPATGMYVVAINPHPIDPQFEERLAKHLKRLKEEYGVYVPGISKGLEYERARAEGIDIADETIEQLRSMI